MQGEEVKRMLKLFTYFQSLSVSLRDREEGQALAEYALILALIAVVAVVALTALGTNVAAKLQSIADELA